MDGLTREIEWFLRTLTEEFDLELSAEDISVEAIELGLSEVESFFVPSELFEVVPETLLYEIMLVEDTAENEWVGAVAFYPETPEWCLQVITKNGELVFRKTLPSPKEKS